MLDMLYYIYLIILSISQLCTPQPQVLVNSTTIVGRNIKVLGSVDQEFFGGIPYADAGRFQAPMTRTLDVPSFDATAHGPACPQTGASGTSEACLTLDILRPTPIPDTGWTALPVMVWVYGGNFLNGQSSIYNASGLVVESVARGTPTIFVGLNYRTGPFGFPQGREAEQRGALNLGIKDILAALIWVHSNIGSFGGDPTKVTTFGQSAGSVSIALLYLHSGLENLVHAAIFESGSQSTIPIYNATVREPAWLRFVNATPECAGAASTNTFQCLQSADLNTLISSLDTTLGIGSQEFPFPPVIDGPGGLIPDLPSKLLAQGQFSHIPFIAGTVLDEGTIFVSTDINASTDNDLVSLLSVRDVPFMDGAPTFVEAAQTLLALYPDDPAAGSPFNTGDESFGFNPQYKRFAAIVGDFEYQALRRAWSQNATSAGVKNYAYQFAVPDARSSGQPWLGINHASDISYALGNVLLDNSTTPSAKLASVMIMNYFLSFAATLDPNDGRGIISRPQWTQYSADSRFILQMGSPFAMISDNYRDAPMSSINNASAIYAH